MKEMPSNSPVEQDMPKAKAEKPTPRAQAEQFRNSLAERLKEINREIDPSRREVLKRLQESPLFILMKELRRGIEPTEEVLSEPNINRELVASGNIPGNEAADAVTAYLEGKELWQDFQKTHTLDLVKSATAEATTKVPELIEKNKQKQQQRAEEHAARLAEAEEELRKLEESEAAQMLATLKSIGFSSHQTPEENLRLLQENKSLLPADIQTKLELQAQEGGSLLSKLFRRRSAGELVILRELDEIISAYAQGVDSLSKKIEKIESSAQKKKPLNEGTAFASLYRDKLRKLIFENITGNHLQRAEQAVAYYDILSRQEYFIDDLLTASKAVSEPEEFLVATTSIVDKSKVKIEDVNSDIRLNLERLSVLETKEDNLRLSPINTADDVVKKLRRQRQIEEERRKILKQVEEEREMLPFYYDKHTSNISSEAALKLIMDDEEKLKKVLGAYQDISKELFGVPVESLPDILSVHRQLLDTLKYSAMDEVDMAILRNASGDSSYNFSDLYSFKNGGGQALIIKKDVNVKKYCTEGHNVSHDPISGDYKPWKDEYKSMPFSFLPGNKRMMWMPINNDVNLSNLSRAVSWYTSARAIDHDCPASDYGGLPCDRYSASARLLYSIETNKE